MRKVALLCFLVVVFINSKLYAEVVLDLNTTILKALRENHYVKSKRYELMSKEKEFNLSKDAFFPKLYLEERFTTGNYNSYGVFTRLNQETLNMGNFLSPGTVSNFQTSLNLEMPVYVKELFINKDIKRSFFLSSKNHFDSFKEQIAFEVFKAYLGVLRAKSLKNLAEKALEESKEIHRVAILRYENGLGVKADELRAYVLKKDREVKLLKAENDLLVAKKALSLVLADENIYDVEEISFNEEIVPPLEEGVRQALIFRKELISDKLSLEGVTALIDIEKAKYYPKIFFSASYYNDSRNYPIGGDGSGYVAGVYLKWDIFDKTRSESREKAALESMRLSEVIRQKEKEIEFNVRESYVRLNEAKKRLELAKETITSAEETFRLIKVRYNNSLATMVELLDAELAVTMARNNFVMAQKDYYEALGKTLFEIGILTDRILKAGR